jgi:hypothetical protein
MRFSIWIGIVSGQQMQQSQNSAIPQLTPDQLSQLTPTQLQQLYQFKKQSGLNPCPSIPTDQNCAGFYITDQEAQSIISNACNKLPRMPGCSILRSCQTKYSGTYCNPVNLLGNFHFYNIRRNMCRYAIYQRMFNVNPDVWG